MENHHALKNGKPSISIRAIYTMAMLNNQMVNSEPHTKCVLNSDVTKFHGHFKSNRNTFQLLFQLKLGISCCPGERNPLFGWLRVQDVYRLFI
jgi:hypothetical protein